jgi:competence protein ComK
METNVISRREDYEISPFTFAVMPVEYGSKTYSKIIEFDDEILVPLRPSEVVKSSCDYFGADYPGRCQSTKTLLGISHKVPISLEPGNRLFFFPTTSPAKESCIWLSYEHIVSRVKISSTKTQINFHNKQSIVIPVSYSIIENQMLRTALLKSKLLQNLAEAERKTNYLYNALQVNDRKSDFQTKSSLNQSPNRA